MNPRHEYPLTAGSWGPEERAAIERVIASDRFTMGPEVKAFEAEFARKFGSKHAVMVSSGSMANLIGLAAFFYKKENPLRRGDEVLVPAVSWATTYAPFQQHGLKLRFVDVELETLNVDFKALEAALTPRTRMVVAVSILGNPCALVEMRAFCDRHGLYLFEDNCESMGAEVGGKAAGTFGDVGTFSTFHSHHISTMEGGVIVTDSEELAHLAISLRAHGWTRDLPAGSPIFEPKADDFFEAYRFILPGYNARPLELSGAIGREQLKKFGRLLEARLENAKHFRALFQGDERFILQRENGRSSWYSFAVVLNPKKNPDRARLMKAMQAAGIEFRIITGGNFLRHDAIRYFEHDIAGQIVNADIVHDNGFFVGNPPVDARAKLDLFHEVASRAV